jgi:arylsulfatase A
MKTYVSLNSKIILITLAFTLLTACNNTGELSDELPNFIIVFADDLGYGDLSSFGHPTIRTPNLDKMASEGMRFTQFYVAANVCSPSRAALLTGRLYIRSGVYPGVFFPNAATGLPLDELTIAELLKTKGYKTAIIGKWHLGSQPEYLPTQQGFDYYFGIPYSNDMGKVGSFGNNPDMAGFTRNYTPLPLYRNNEVIEEEPDQRQLTKRYTDEVLKFIRDNQDKPFFVYYPNNFPHTPLYASEDFEGISRRGLYGDVVQELDWSIGQIIKELRELKLDKKTMVVFTSDNGPWLMMREFGGSAGLLFEGKATTYEGGMREPMIAWWPGKIPSNTVNEALASSLDIMPTIMAMAGIEMPGDREYDGMDISGLLYQETDKVRDIIYYYHGDVLRAIRKGPWKAHFETQMSYSREPAKKHDPPLLYNLENDPSEKYEIGNKHPDIIKEMKELYDHQISTVIPAESETSKVIDNNE